MYWEINIQSINKYLLEIMYTFIFLYNEFISVGVGPPYIYIKADIQMVLNYYKYNRYTTICPVYIIY